MLRKLAGSWRQLYRCLFFIGALSLVACGHEIDPLAGAGPLDDVGAQGHAVSSGRSAPLPHMRGAAGGSVSVTLVTGDRVVVQQTKPERVSIVRAPGREAVRFSTHRVEGPSGETRHLYVIPEDAMPLLAADRVDRRLFDVATLIEFGYDDAHRADLPLIVTYPATGLRALSAPLTRSVPGATTRLDLSSINGMAVTSPKARMPEVWSAVAGGSRSRASSLTASVEPIGKLWLDGLRKPILDRSTGQIGAPVAWSLGYEGRGVRVAVLDSGVDATHPDLSAAAIVSQNFTEGPDYDDVGHGTHVASIIAGSGAADGGRYRGVAPGALLLAGKICFDFDCPESSIIAGMQWAVVEQGARVVNMSLGGYDFAEVDPVEGALNALSLEYDALFVVAAGNDGPFDESVSSPASADFALAVAAVNREDGLAEFSSRGLRRGDYAIKPEIAAPGVGIVAARAVGTLLELPVNDDYVAASGTSMAAPHVSGAAALLLERHPDWGAVELKAALMGSALWNLEEGVEGQGAGRVDVEAALDTKVLVDPPSATFGIARWPQQGAAPVDRSFTLRNRGAAVQLSLALETVGPDGAASPAGMFTVEPASLSIPEEGSASVTVTANAGLGEVDGAVYGGRLVATDGAGRTVTAPFALKLEPESYDFTLRHIFREDVPIDYCFTLLVGLDDLSTDFIFAEPGGPDVTRRLQAGDYAVEATCGSFNPFEPSPSVIVAAPNEQLTSDHLLELDTRLAEPVSLPAPRRPEATFTGSTLLWRVSGPRTQMNVIHGFPLVTEPLYYSALLGSPPPSFLSALHAQWDDETETPVALYAGLWAGGDGLPRAPLTPMSPSKTAIVHASYAASATSLPLVNELSLSAESSEGLAIGTGVYADLPLERTEHLFSDDPNVRWSHNLWIHDETYEQSLEFGLISRSFHPGHQRARWNAPVFSPLLPEEAPAFAPPAMRQGDLIRLNPAMYTDGERHAGYISSQGSLRLYRDGALIGESPWSNGEFEVPPEPGTYRVELDDAQSMLEFSTRQRIVWRFESAHVPDGEVRLPLLLVHFDAELDESGRAVLGDHYRLPLEVTQFGRKNPRVRKPIVDVSYDDGATWTRAVVVRRGGRWTAEYRHSRHAKYVSLRARTRDGAGNAVEQTLIRAYALGRRRQH